MFQIDNLKIPEEFKCKVPVNYVIRYHGVLIEGIYRVFFFVTASQ